MANIPLFKGNEIHCRHAEIIVGWYLWMEPRKIIQFLIRELKLKDAPAVLKIIGKFFLSHLN